MRDMWWTLHDRLNPEKESGHCQCAAKLKMSMKNQRARDMIISLVTVHYQVPGEERACAGMITTEPRVDATRDHKSYSRGDGKRPE
ncbi:hypothetical protein PoB_005060700 [Plakobranchus ocellatus]|uniref:Uncharacterized protein n=1 Tax=Plakobranchus ocellatus TaxID=259542 RepID=A0AAV4BXP1_9GAST|nr:hypothetical protein PoB_005060700 [Plakobranchus ocellatus]